MDINARITELIAAGEPFCVVLVLSAEGSTPREAGTKAAVDAQGRIYGTIGGGAVEAEAQRAAVEACQSGEAAVIEVGLSGETAAGREPICGGAMRVLVDPTARKDAAAYHAAAAARRERRQGMLLTEVQGGEPVQTRVTWHPDTREAGWKPAPRAGAETFAEPVLPSPRLLIAGGGHIGQALAAQAVLVGFEVIVLDDRPEFAAAALFPPGVVTQCGDIAAALGECDPDEDTHVVIVTRGHQHDAEALRACLRRETGDSHSLRECPRPRFAYIGMIGSRRKVALVRESFLASGLATEEEFDAVHAPIGLDIGAETVPEIATSILAELIAVRRRGRTGWKPAPRDREAKGLSDP